MLTRIDYACCTIRLLDAFTPSKMSSQMEMMIYNVCCGSQPSPWERKQKVPGLCISLLCVLCIGSSCFLSLENSGIIRETSGWSPVRKKHFFYIEVQLGPLSRIWPFILHIIASPLALLSIKWYVQAETLACWFFFSFAVTHCLFRTSVRWSWGHTPNIWGMLKT